MSENNALNELRERVTKVRSVWKRTIFLTGCAVVLFSLIAILFSGIIIDLLMPLPVIAREILLVGIIGAFGYLAYRFVLKPVRKKLTEHDVALHIEQHHPDLEDRLVSSMQFGDQEQADEISSFMINRLVSDTAARTQDIDFKKTISKKKLQDYWGIALIAVSITLLCVFLFPTQLHQAFSRILSPWERTEHVLATKFMVNPGNTRILSGQNQIIAARVSGKFVRDVSIYYKQGEAEWKNVEMIPAEERRTFNYELFNITQATQYYVAGGNAQSETYIINVYEMPRITAIDVSYTYPEYTKLQPVVQEGTGDIMAVVGTIAQVRAMTNKGIAEATLTVEDKEWLTKVELLTKVEPKPMAITDGRTLTHELTVLENAKYTINLICVDGFNNQEPIEYTITAIKDEAPKVVIKKPGRDIKATKIEEVQIIAEATDDFGVANITLKYAVGSEKERDAAMKLSATDDSKKVSSEYMFYLEELAIEPGNVITYHAEAYDNNTRNGPSKGVSEIYFIEIRPFKERFEEMTAESGDS